jgi:hypothetical protein
MRGWTVGQVESIEFVGRDFYFGPCEPSRLCKRRGHIIKGRRVRVGARHERHHNELWYPLVGRPRLRISRRHCGPVQGSAPCNQSIDQAFSQTSRTSLDQAGSPIRLRSKHSRPLWGKTVPLDPKAQLPTRSAVLARTSARVLCRSLGIATPARRQLERGHRRLATRGGPSAGPPRPLDPAAVGDGAPQDTMASGSLSRARLSMRVR